MTNDVATERAQVAAARALFEQAYAAFERARERAGAVESTYRLAGHGLTLSFAGSALVSALTPAFEHLAYAHPRTAGTDDLTICVWEGASAAVAPPPPSWVDTGYLGNSELRGDADDRVQMAFDSYLGTLSMFDADRRLALFWLRDARHVPITLAGTPFRIILQWWAALHGGQLIHAAALGSDRGGVAIVGPSGAGKSTTALIALESGLLYAGDDFVLVRPDAGPRVFSVYNSAKLDTATLAARFPGLRSAVHDRPRLPEEKHVLFVHRRWAERMALELSLRALLLPVFGEGHESRLVPVGAASALRILVPGILPFPGQRAAAVARLARLVRAVPSYRLELGRDSAGVANALRVVLGEQSSGGTIAQVSHQPPLDRGRSASAGRATARPSEPQ